MNTHFTLDTNCVIAVAEQRPEAPAILSLAKAHENGAASVALVAISASERQQDGKTLSSFTLFKERLSALGLGHLELIKPLAYLGIGYFDWCLLSGKESIALEQRIHEVLFPAIPFRWPDYCTMMGIAPESSAVGTSWRNAKCDVQAYWSHIHHKREVFVTTDGNFHKATKKASLLSMFGGQISTPSEAAQLLDCGANAA